MGVRVGEDITLHGSKAQAISGKIKRRGGVTIGFAVGRQACERGTVEGAVTRMPSCKNPRPLHVPELISSSRKPLHRAKHLLGKSCPQAQTGSGSASP